MNGTNALKSLMRDRLTFVKKDGTVFRENVVASVTTDKIQTFEKDLPVQKDDHFLRSLPSGLIEDFIVEKADFNNGIKGAIDPNWIIEVHRNGEPANSKQTILASISGHNSRMYINSNDSSINISSPISGDQLVDLVSQIKASFSALPEKQRAEIQAPLQILEKEASVDKPVQSVVNAALQSIKVICEGAGGNLVAQGITGLIISMMGGG